MKHFILKYGKGKLSLDLNFKNLVGILSLKKEKKEDPFSQIESALDQPINSSPFNDFFAHQGKISIVTSDITRYTGSEYFLPILLKRLSYLGIKDSSISITIALGIHRPQTLSEIRKIVTNKVLSKIKVFNHNPEDKGNLKYLFTTTRGTPVYFNRRVIESDKIILTGAIGFHYFAGFSGGRKSLLPGIASRETCINNHLLVLQKDGGKHPAAITGKLMSNPVHEDMMEACKELPPVFLLNTILSPDKKILKVIAGDLNMAFIKGCEIFREYYTIPIREKADLVIASCGGYPKDINFIQAHKALEYAMNSLKDNGVIILLAKCEEGFGSGSFLKWFKYKDLKEFEENLRLNYEIYGQTAFSTYLKTKKATIILISSLPPEEVKLMSMIPAKDMKEALSLAKTILGDSPTIYIIPDAGITLPVLLNK